ncbi:endolytic transglycosylase MltG [Mycobacterium koreense]|uniref:Endolytic murein transglycosylase n=1 Tax=Mycolicibacillus koreensis TaxID=1069220 RepID=A0A7I7SBH9_9MYCO|nr:endolytic transglycosylase MltG [Mycolicibacillus koreensis]MCV7249003.1 endolytic transglycosylase MltG [Mycolicibacillus koreensis]OSC34536.1 aminodeoxychorismate lyase [Mycolicibacillus koreensis]BBY53850.1 membrane protein [Mycolicibacillus koreensis]
MADTGRPRAKPVAVGPPRHRLPRRGRATAEKSGRRRRITGWIVGGLLTVIVLALVVLGAKLWDALPGHDADYTGDGERDVVIEVHDGDTTTAVGQTLHDFGVVATVRAFVDAAHGNSGISAIQPGFYRMRTVIPAATAVSKLTDPNNRVGRLVIPEGRQLDDTVDMKTEEVTAGIFSLISQASCVELNGVEHCVTVEDLRAAASTEPPTGLSVPPWAALPVTQMGRDHRRIEGLIVPGSWNVDPSASATTILSTLIADSARMYTGFGLPRSADSLAMSPYDVLTVASLVQRETKPEDFPKVARVIYNRLHQHRKLEFDSTVNYRLDRQEVATTDADRAKRTPWNTYMAEGLPATPICSPGDEALQAAEHPAEGNWLFFVTVDLEGTTLFTDDYQQHLANIEKAKNNGVLDSVR